ncbi:MAG: MFS transporter [Actinomycetota bacterium]|nr:MFS transporter [Acidimicrobiales bacterium]MEC8921995.1 MFS transporter [Actinomycetota bacterium]MED5172654.1 MFS transporter [Actinomycetota bacterium]
MPGNRSIFRGWKVVGSGIFIQFIQSGLIMQAMGSYLVVLERQFGWSKSVLSAAFSVNRFESALLGPLQGWMLDRLGPKRIARIGSVFLVLGFLWFGRIQNLWEFFVSFLLIAIGAALSGFLTVTVAIVRWFERRRARALATGSLGFAAGGLAVPIVVWSMNANGWRATASVSGVVAGAAVYFFARYLDGYPADYGETVDGLGSGKVARTPTVEGLTSVDFTAREAIRTRAFWMISLGHMSALFVVGAVMAHLALFLTSERGYSLQQASFVGAALPIMQIVGMTIGGALGDRVNKRLIASLAMLGHAGGILILAFAERAWMIGVFVALHGLAWGARGPLMQALRADYFGASSFGFIMGLSSLIVMLGIVLGPIIAGVLADATGTYRAGFLVVGTLAALGMVFFVLATPPAPPNRSAPPSMS